MSSLEGVRVLLVEDESLVAMLLETILEDAGCVVVGPAGRLSDAMTLVEAGGFDAALLDVNVGGEPVFPVAEALAARGAPFAFSSGYGAGGLPPGWAGRPVVAKPFDEAGVLGALREALLRSPSGRA